MPVNKEVAATGPELTVRSVIVGLAECMKEVERAKGIRLVEINRAVSNQVFVEECLKSAVQRQAFAKASRRCGAYRIANGQNNNAKRPGCTIANQLHYCLQSKAACLSGS
jgi:hypothetical protein